MVGCCGDTTPYSHKQRIHTYSTQQGYSKNNTDISKGDYHAKRK